MESSGRGTALMGRSLVLGNTAFGDGPTRTRGQSSQKRPARIDGLPVRLGQGGQRDPPFLDRTGSPGNESSGSATSPARRAGGHRFEPIPGRGESCPSIDGIPPAVDHRARPSTVIVAPERAPQPGRTTSLDLRRQLVIVRRLLPLLILSVVLAGGIA